jgi:hypothetical protein
VSVKSGTKLNSFKHHMLHMLAPSLHATSQPLYRLYEDFAHHTRLDSSTTVCNSMSKVTNTSDLSRIHLCLQESPEYKVQES